MLLVGRLACKELDVGLLVVTFYWSFARLTASVVTTTSVIVSDNKFQIGDILLPTYKGWVVLTNETSVCLSDCLH